MPADGFIIVTDLFLTYPQVIDPGTGRPSYLGSADQYDDFVAAMSNKTINIDYGAASGDYNGTVTTGEYINRGNTLFNHVDDGYIFHDNALAPETFSTWIETAMDSRSGIGGDASVLSVTLSDGTVIAPGVASFIIMDDGRVLIQWGDDAAVSSPSLDGLAPIVSVNIGQLDTNFIGRPNYDLTLADDGYAPADAGILDYNVDGTAGNDTIDASYTGDPQGDMVDNNDHHDGSNDDVILAYAGNDVAYGGAGDDTIYGFEGDDTLYGEVGNDVIGGGDGNDLIYGGTGNDSMTGSIGEDTFIIEDNFGQDTIVGGTNQPTNSQIDVIDMSGMTTGVTVDFSDPDWMTGTITSGTDTIEYTEIEKVILGAGADVVKVTEITGGTDYIWGFDTSDSGDGTSVDKINVADFPTYGPVTADRVSAFDGGNGNSFLVFPSGTILWLMGVPYSEVDTEAEIARLLTTETTDGIVHGTTGDDSMPIGFVDAQGDIIDGADGNDDIILADAGNDTIDAGLGNDSVEGGAGNDSILGNAGNDTIDGGAGNDIINGGAGNDSMTGGDGDDTFLLTDGFGTDTIIGSETGETNGDTLDLSGLTTGVTVDLTNANAEIGSVTDGTNTAGFTDIENITLGGGRDTLTLADGSGADDVNGFDMADSGDGTTNDQLDVSGLTSDGGTTPVTTDDVTVTDDGSGNAVLTFPGGETITLVGVAPTQLDTPAKLESIGIPAAGPTTDGIVHGTTGDDSMPIGFVDAQGDIIDGADGNDDTILADAGNDTVDAGLGNDSVEGGAGADSLFGNDGADVIYGGTENDTIDGGLGDDTLFGEAGDDRFLVSGGSDQLDGGTGDDVFIAQDGASAVIVGGENAGDNDVLNLSGLTDYTIAFDPADSEAGTVTLLDALGNPTGNTITFSQIETVICFAAGTRITTPKGEVEAQDLAIGDLVTTLDHGDQPIRWIGRRVMKAKGPMAPVVFKEGAIGNTRELRVSPQHRMMLSDWRAEVLFGEPEILTAAKNFVNGDTIYQDHSGEVEYIHIMFDTHEIVFAEGVASESFQPGEMGAASIAPDQYAELMSIFPELKADLNAYGPSARTSLKAFESRVLLKA